MEFVSYGQVLNAFGEKKPHGMGDLSARGAYMLRKSFVLVFIRFGMKARKQS
jgi:hypothetical protein